MEKPSRKRPAELAPAPWPEQPSADPVGEVARQFVVQLRHAIGSRSIRSVAAEARLDHATIVRVLAGQVWPDLSTIARLELALDTALWRSDFTSAEPNTQHSPGFPTSDSASPSRMQQRSDP